MNKQKYVIIEQAEGNEAYITRIENPEDYESIGIGVFICLSEEAYNNLCLSGCGC